MPKTLPPKRSSFLSRLLDGFGSKKVTAKEEVPAAVRRFQAIAIYHGVRACDLARKFSEHRFLTRDAPPLPLAGCTMGSTCECKYLKYKDRRSNQRRLVDFGAPARMFTGEERRKKNGRRTTD
jgi:hypothetical protein